MRTTRAEIEITSFPGFERSITDMLRFIMDPDRSCLSVVIPVHEEFISKAEKKQNQYQEKIRAAIGQNLMTLTEISTAMGYKGITKKLRDSVNAMVVSGTLDQFIEERSSFVTGRGKINIAKAVVNVELADVINLLRTLLLPIESETL